MRKSRCKTFCTLVYRIPDKRVSIRRLHHFYEMVRSGKKALQGKNIRRKAETGKANWTNKKICNLKNKSLCRPKGKKRSINPHDWWWWTTSPLGSADMRWSERTTLIHSPIIHRREFLKWEWNEVRVRFLNLSSKWKQKQWGVMDTITRMQTDTYICIFVSTSQRENSEIRRNDLFRMLRTYEVYTCIPKMVNSISTLCRYILQTIII